MTAQIIQSSSDAAPQGDGAPDFRSFETEHLFDVTPEMVEAGEAIVFELAGEVSKATLAKEVWKAMAHRWLDRLHLRS